MNLPAISRYGNNAGPGLSRQAVENAGKVPTVKQSGWLSATAYLTLILIV
jgi:hypothetical protein